MDDIYIWQTSQGHKWIIIYFIVINLIGFALMGIDKYKARNGYWRISENTLFIVAILGGALGTFAGMYRFRHKTQKSKFLVGFPVILVLWIMLIIYLCAKGVFWA